MADGGVAFRESCDFRQLERIPTDFYWLGTPPDHEFVSRGNCGGLGIRPAAQTDFWQRTFYAPVIAKSDGVALLRQVPAGLEEWSAEVRFSLENAKHRFDQAGLMVFRDQTHWAKAGVEVVDGVPNMSCVVTSDASDWSLLPWRSLADVALRVSCVRNSLVFEYGGEGGEWKFYRISPRLPDGGDVRGVGVGMFCCAPKCAGMEAVFHSFSVSDSVSFGHHA